MKRLIQFSINHSLLVNLITLLVFIAGIFAIAKINREAFPNVNYDRVLITTLYPGAAPDSVEKLVTIPIEREIKEVSDIREMTSASVEGRSVIVLKLEPFVRNTDRLINDIQQAVDRAEDLPLDLEDPPRVTEVRSKDQPIIQVSLSGAMPEGRLVEHAKILEKRFLDFPETAAVARKGWRDGEIWVEVRPETLAEYYFSLDDVMGALRDHNVNVPGGDIRSGAAEFLLRTSGEFEGAEDVKKVILRANDGNHWVQVGDIARVEAAFEEESVIHRTNGTRAINLVVIKKERADAITLTKKVREAVATYQSRTVDAPKAAFVNDFSFYIKRRLKVLYANGAFGFLLILVSLFLFLAPRVALVTAIGVPFALLATFFVMQMSGMTLNLLTMFGLITVLGMLVDDAIVVSENVYRYREQGLPVREACVRGTLEVWKPVTSSVLTTIFVFVPLLFMTGVMGKFVKYIPLMVIIALLASLTEVFLVLPSHIADWTGKKTVASNGFKERFARFSKKYGEWLVYFLKHRYRVALGFLVFFLFGIFLYFQIPFTLFPSRGVETFFIRSEAPVGTPLEETARRFEQLERLVETLPGEEWEDYVLQVGIQQNDPHDPFTERFSHLGQIQVFLTPPAERKRSAQEIVRDLQSRDFKPEGLAELRFDLMKAGPPVGKPIAIRLRSENLGTIRRLSEKVQAELAKIPGVQDIKPDEEPGKEELRFVLDRVRAAKAGVSLKEIGTAIRASFEGIVATTIRKTDEEIDIRVRFPLESSHEKISLQGVRVMNRTGKLIPLTSLGIFETGRSVTAIRHFDRERTLTVLANVDEEKTSVVEVEKKFQPLVRQWESEFPEMDVRFGGEFEETGESLANLKQAFILGALMIFMLLAVQFNTLWQPFVVMMAIPLGLVGVLFAFWLHDEPKSFLGLMGMVGLAGVVVNNAIVLVDFINAGRARGMGKRESIIEAGVLRLRPVILTSVTTVFGLISLAYGFWGSDPFLKPMALAFVWGIAFATILTLIAIPCFHAIADDCLERFRKKRGA